MSSFVRLKGTKKPRDALTSGALVPPKITRKDVSMLRDSAPNFQAPAYGPGFEYATEPTPVPLRANKSHNGTHRTKLRDGLFTTIECEVAYTLKHTPGLDDYEVDLGEVVNVIRVTHEPEWRVHGERRLGGTQERWLDPHSVRDWTKAANYLLSEYSEKFEDGIIREIVAQARG